jgi:pyruvate/2-oxoacid:ferredoxin oxidoreductase alpha subunit
MGASAAGVAVWGVKSMTATSGPRVFAQAENLGFAVETEIPVRRLNVQRVGRSTVIAGTSPAQFGSMSWPGRAGARAR